MAKRSSKTSLYILALIQKLKNKREFKRPVSLSKRELSCLVSAIAGLAYEGKIPEITTGTYKDMPDEWNSLSRLIKKRAEEIIYKELQSNLKLNGNDKRKALIAQKDEQEQLVRWAIISGDKELFKEIGPEYYRLIDELSCNDKEDVL